MPQKPIADDVLQFLDANVDSIEQLEILRNLGEDPGKIWSADDLARVTQVEPSIMPAHLSALEGRGLVRTQTHEGRLACQYNLQTTQAAGMLTRLLQAYKEHPVTLIRIVYERADERLKAFAEAFRLRKEK